MTDFSVEEVLKQIVAGFARSENPDATLHEASMFLGHDSTMRVSQLLHKGTLEAGVKPKTVTRESVLQYAVDRKVQGTKRWFKILLEPDDESMSTFRAWFKSQYGEWPDVRKLYKYDATARKRGALKKAGAGAHPGRFDEELDPDISAKERMINEADDEADDDTTF